MNKKKTFGLFSRKQILIIFACAVIVCFLLLKLVPYSYENYRNSISTMSQIVATIFAFIVGGTLLLIQMVEGRSPRAIEALPKRAIINIFLFYSAVLSADLIVSILLPSETTDFQRGVLIAVLLMNMASVFMPVPYVKIIMGWMRPRSLIEFLVKRAEERGDIDQRKEIIRSLEEFAMNIAEKRQLQTATEVLNAYGQLGQIFATG